MQKRYTWILLSFLVVGVLAQPRSKEDGEMEQILERVKWFQQARGLNSIPRPDLLRASAVADLKVARRQMESVQTSGWIEMGPSPMNMLSWQMGQVAGRIDAIAPVPGDINTIYLGAAAGGLWKTTNGGTLWTPIFDDIGTLTIGSIYVEPGNTDHVWVGTGEHQAYCSKYFGLGLFKSEDGGQTFSEKNGSGAASLSLSFISGVAVSRSNPQIVIVGGDGFCSDGSSFLGGLYQSTDGGDSWTRKISRNISEVVMHPTNDQIFYASVVSSSSDNGVWRSTDSGASWQQTSSGLPGGSSRLRLVISPSNPDILYALVYPSGSNSSIYKSIDGGLNWVAQNNDACEGQCSYNQCIAVHPTDPNSLLVGSIRFAKSTNSGGTLNYLTTGWGSFQKVHQDTHVLVYDPSDGNRFWVGGDGGIWRSDNGGSSFVNLNAGLNITQFYDIAVDPGDPTKILGGAQDNSSSMTQNNKVWDVTVVSGDGFMNLIDPLDTKIVYQTSYPSGGLPHLVRSRTGGAGGWVWLGGSGLTVGEPWPWVTPLAISANPEGTQTHVFIGSNRIYRSDDDASNWTPLSGSALSGSSFSVIVPHVESGKLELYAGSSSGIWKTENALAPSVQWDNITNNYPVSYVTDIAVTPGDHKWIFVTTGNFGVANQLYRSADQGKTWESVGAGIPNIPANTVAIDPHNPLRIFVGTDIGVYVSEDQGETFIPMMNGMPLGNVITDLEIDDNPYTLTAGTYGRGAWQTNLSLPLTAAAGMDQSTCVGDPISVSATANAGIPGYSWLWNIVSGPDTSSTQFLDSLIQTTQFTPALAGDYTLQIEITDAQSQTATDTLFVYVGDKAVFSLEIREHWPLMDTSSRDRNHNGKIDIQDMMIQDTNPICK